MIPSAVFEAASITPEIGFSTSPPIPLAVPNKKPGNPFFSAPLTGYEKRPVNPFLNPFAMLLAPFANPPNTCSLLSFLIFYLYLANWWSWSTRSVIPLPKDPVID